MQAGTLTDKQRKFVDEYMIDLNATQAAIRAGYSVHSAADIGGQLLAKTQVADAIGKATAERSRRTGVNADRVVRELAKLAFADLSDVASLDDASIRDGAKKDETAAIQSVKVKTIPTEDGCITEREVKLCDKNKALELLGRHLGMFVDKVKLEDTPVVILKGDDQVAD